jgi:hypothetical protein
MSTVVEKMKQAKLQAEKPGGTTGDKLPYAKNPYSPHTMDLDKRAKETQSRNMWWNDIWRKGSKAKNKALRAEMYEKYNVHKNVKHLVETKYVFINQGVTGGCFLASLLSMLQLVGASKELDNVLQTYKTPLASLKSGKNFERLFLKEFKLVDEGYGTYWQPLQDLQTFVPDLIDVTKDIDFIWIRYKALGRALRRIKGDYNPKIGGINLTSTEEYNKKVLAYLRKLLDNGYVFAAPFNGHFISYIGYNKDGFLALGSYGENADKAGLHEVNETLNFADAIASCLVGKVPPPIDDVDDLPAAFKKVTGPRQKTTNLKF